MAVTFHNATVTAGPASVGTATILHTVSAADACLLVYTHANTAVSFSAIAANGLQLTRLGHISASSSRAEVWGLTAAPLATLSISANVVGAASLNFCLVAVSYIGQRQFGGSPFGTVVAGTAQAVANVAFSVSSTSLDLVSYGFGISANTTIAFNTGTSRGNTTHTTTGRLVVGEITGAATISISATAAAAGTWSFLGVPIVASAVVATTIRFDNAAYTATPTLVNTIGLVITAAASTCLLVFVGGGDINQTVSSIAIGSTQLTRLGLISNYSNRSMELWGLTAAPSGVLTISANMANGAFAAVALGAVTYTGAKIGGNPFGGVVSGTAAAALSIALTVSTTSGNVAVFGFAYDFTPGVATIGPGSGLTQRLITGSTEWPDLLIADCTANQANLTGSANAAVITQWGALGINLIQQGTVNGSATMTDVADKFSASGYVLVRGSISCTAAADKFSASGQVIVTGRLSATEAADRFSASGQVIVNGRLSATDVTDKFSASGYVVVSGRLSATGSTDRFSATGYVVVSGRLSATEAADFFSASGNVLTVGNINGRLSATEAADFFSASGTVIAVSTPTVVDTQDPGAGGGHKKQKEYVRQDDAFWEAREKYLLSLQPAIATEPEPAPLSEVASIPALPIAPIDASILIGYRLARDSIINKLPDASSMRQLKAQGKRLYEVNARIAEQKRLQAIANEQERLNRARAARQLKRAQDIRRIKRRVVLLAAARAAVALTYLYGKL